MSGVGCPRVLVVHTGRLPCTLENDHAEVHSTTIRGVCILSWGTDDAGNGWVNGGELAFLFPRGYLPTGLADVA